MNTKHYFLLLTLLFVVPVCAVPNQRYTQPKRTKSYDTRSDSNKQYYKKNIKIFDLERGRYKSPILTNLRNKNKNTFITALQILNTEYVDGDDYVSLYDIDKVAKETAQLYHIKLGK